MPNAYIDGPKIENVETKRVLNPIYYIYFNYVA
jgi:hypothetical protein